MKKLFFVLFALFCLSSSAFALRMPPQRCAKVTKLKVQTFPRSPFVQVTATFRGKARRCSLMDISIPAYSRKVVAMGAYSEVQPNNRYVTGRLRLGSRSSVKTRILFKVSNNVHRADLVATIVKMAKHIKKKKGMTVRGPNGTRGELKLFLFSSHWRAWAKKVCRRKFKANTFFAKTSYLTTSRRWCLRTFPSIARKCGGRKGPKC